MSLRTLNEPRWMVAAGSLPVARSSAPAIDMSDALFQKRASAGFMVGYCLLTILIIAHLIAGAGFSFSCWAAACVAVSFLITSFVRDKAIAFVLTFPTWMFVFTGYLYASAQLFTIDSRLTAASQTITLVFVCQLAALAALLLLQFFGVGLQKPRLLRKSDPDDDFPEIRMLVMIVLTIPIVLAAVLYEHDHGAANAPLQAAGTLALSFLILTMAVQFHDPNSSKGSTIVLVLVLALIFAVSVARNERTNLLLLSAFLGCTALISVQRLFTFWRCVGLIYIAKALSNFSLITLYVRQVAQRDDLGDVASKFVSVFFSIDNIVSILTLRSLEIGRQFAYVNYSPVFDLKFFSGDRSVVARLVEIAQLDIVVRFSDLWKPIDYQELWLRIATALPNFGQQKDIIFGDRIFAAAGIRNLYPENPLQPMITAIGEFSYIGGVPVVFVAFVVIFSLFIIGALILREYLNRNAVFANIIVILCFNMIFTSAATSTISVVIRTIPMCIVMLFGLRMASRIVRRSRL